VFYVVCFLIAKLLIDFYKFQFQLISFNNVFVPSKKTVISSFLFHDSDFKSTVIIVKVVSVQKTNNLKIVDNKNLSKKDPATIKGYIIKVVHNPRKRFDFITHP
jgi:hypothetical protein